MKIIYFDICAIPLFLIILFLCYSRKMTRGTANRLFIAVVYVSLFSVIADLGMEIPNGLIPLSAPGYVICTISTYIYFVFRNANNVVLLLFLVVFTKTTFLIRKKWVNAVFWIPYVFILIMLAQNPFTRNIFTISAETGYTRGPLIIVLYVIALVYGLVGLGYCIYCRRYLSAMRWAALLSIYILAHLAVLIQFIYPDLLLEMFSTAIGELLIMLSIISPDQRMDSEAGCLSWSAYQVDLRNILKSGEHVQILVIQLLNFQSIRNYLGDHKYNRYLFEIADEIRDSWNELYFERPGTLYLIGNAHNVDEEQVRRTVVRVSEQADIGVQFETKSCLIRVPEDLQKAEEIIILGHSFYKTGIIEETIYHACDIVHSQNFAIEAHIEKIIGRSLKEGQLEMYYQPIYDLRSGRFTHAEALARIIDSEYGLVSPAVFIPAAEEQGFMIPVGDVVLQQVFQFVSKHELQSLGLSCIELNLSIAQCMDRQLPDKIRALQEQYHIDPSKIILEITETTFENISDVILENVDKLLQMGYKFALDDYGIGYSNIQRINHLSLQYIKIDKSVIDDAFSVNGRKILSHTVGMMQSIGKKLIAEGVETEEELEILQDMDCDYIQGFYFSKPLPEEVFVQFMKKQQ